MRSISRCTSIGGICCASWRRPPTPVRLAHERPLRAGMVSSGYAPIYCTRMHDALALRRNVGRGVANLRRTHVRRLSVRARSLLPLTSFADASYRRTMKKRNARYEKGSNKLYDVCWVAAWRSQPPLCRQNCSAGCTFPCRVATTVRRRRRPLRCNPCDDYRQQ